MRDLRNITSARGLMAGASGHLSMSWPCVVQWRVQSENVCDSNISHSENKNLSHFQLPREKFIEYENMKTSGSFATAAEANSFKD